MTVRVTASQRLGPLRLRRSRTGAVALIAGIGWARRRRTLPDLEED